MTSSIDIQDLISGKGFIMVNKGLARMVGLVSATIYGELVSTHQYWKGKNQLTMIDGKEWFFCTVDDLEDKTSVKKDTQIKSVKALEKEGFLITKRHGLPARRYFHLTDKYVNLLVDNYFSQKPNTDSTNDSGEGNTQESHSNQYSQKPTTTILKSRQLEVAKADTNNKALNNKALNNLKQERDIKYTHTHEEEEPIKNEESKLPDAGSFLTTDKEKAIHKKIHVDYENNTAITKHASVFIQRASNKGELSIGAMFRSLFKIACAMREGVLIESILSYFDKVYAIELKSNEFMQESTLENTWRDVPAIATNKVPFYDWLQIRE